MQRFCILLAALGMSLQAFGQKDPPVLIPLSPEDEWNRPVVYIETDCVRDTMPIKCWIAVRFDKPLEEGVRIDEAPNIYPQNIRYIDDTGNKKDIFRDNTESEFERCIYDACDRTFRVLLKRQPYSDMEGIEFMYGYTAFVVFVHVRLVPKAPNPAE